MKLMVLSRRECVDGGVSITEEDTHLISLSLGGLSLASKLKKGSGKQDIP